MFFRNTNFSLQVSIAVEMSEQVAIVRNSEYQLECISLFQQLGVKVRGERANALLAVWTLCKSSTIGYFDI